MKKLIFVILICLFSTSTLFAQDGATLYKSKGCMTCHGVNGKKPLVPTYPKIAGQNSAYTLTQLKEFKSGKRNGSQAAIMKSFAVALTEKEMEAIAKFLESVK